MEKDKTATNQLNNKSKTMEVRKANNITKQALEWNPQGIYFTL
jgi:hypothetical protein